MHSPNLSFSDGFILQWRHVSNVRYPCGVFLFAHPFDHLCLTIQPECFCLYECHTSSCLNKSRCAPFPKSARASTAPHRPCSVAGCPAIPPCTGKDASGPFPVPRLQAVIGLSSPVISVVRSTLGTWNLGTWWCEIKSFCLVCRDGVRAEGVSLSDLYWCKDLSKNGTFFYFGKPFVWYFTNVMHCAWITYISYRSVSFSPVLNSQSIWNIFEKSVPFGTRKESKPDLKAA